MMRILVATDGSPASGRCIELLRGLQLPMGTEVTVLGVIPPHTALFGAPYLPIVPGDAQEQESAVVAAVEARLRAEASAIERDGVHAVSTTRRGRPAQEIADAAETLRADLIVVGHRGLGTVGSILLGSVSAEVVDRAHCAILVVRRPTIERSVLAIDDTPAAKAAIAFLEQTPCFAGSGTDVLGVVDTDTGDSIGIAAPGFLVESARARHDEWTSRARDTVRAAAARLERSGIDCRTTVREGRPVDTIVASVTLDGASLIVVGSRGHTGLTRLLVGSVARGVLLHAQASVLIVKQHPTPIQGHRVMAHTVVGHAFG